MHRNKQVREDVIIEATFSCQNIDEAQGVSVFNSCKFVPYVNVSEFQH